MYQVPVPVLYLWSFRYSLKYGTGMVYGTVGTGTVVTTAYNMDSDKTKILSFSIQQIAS